MRAAVALLALIGSSTLLATVLAVVGGALTPGIALTSLGFGLIVAVGAFRSTRAIGKDAHRRSRVLEAIALTAFAIAALRQFLWLAFERNGAMCTLDGYNIGDLPLHWTYIRYLASGASFWPENPIFTGHRLQYPMGIDLFTALFVKLGTSPAMALRLIGLAAAALAAATLGRWGGGFAVAAFLFSGGFGPDVAWKNLFLALFVPQRGLLYALPGGVTLLWSWRERLFRGRQGLPAWLEGLLWGVMPLFHLHTFLFVSLIYALWALAQSRVRSCLASFLWALAPAAWTTWQVTDHFAAAALVWWKPGWTVGQANLVVFLLQNFTLFLPLALWTAFLALRHGDREARLAVFPALILFAALFFVMLAPWDWDNTKMMIWCYLLLLPTLGDAIASLKRWPRVIVLLAALLPGALAVADSLGPDHDYEIYEISETQAGCTALSSIPVGDRIATAQTFNHPVALCGHPLVAGYSGHLWSHGIHAQDVERRLRSLMLGRPGWEETARSLQAHYLFWGPREEAAFARSSRPWETGRVPVAEGPWGSLYKLED